MREVLDRLITHLLLWTLFVPVSLELEGGSLGVVFGAVVESALVEGVGAMGVAGTVDWLEVGVKVLEKLDGTLWCLLKVFCWSMLSKFDVCLVKL